MSVTYLPTHCAACLMASKVRKSEGLMWNLVCKYSRRSLYVWHIKKETGVL